MREYLSLIISAAVVGIVFLFLWRKGYVMRLRTYLLETREELRKCTWPTWTELQGSTIVVMVTILLLGTFTVGIDFLIAMLVRLMIQA